MSGGNWDYVGSRIQNSLDEIANDHNVKERFSILSNLLKQLGTAIAKVEHDLDWDISGDKTVEKDDDFEKSAIADFLEVVMKNAPDEWFPRGKWATIQAVQSRVGDGR